jgi:hypothetical protein
MRIALLSSALVAAALLTAPSVSFAQSGEPNQGAGRSPERSTTGQSTRPAEERGGERRDGIEMKREGRERSGREGREERGERGPGIELRVLPGVEIEVGR